MDPKVEDTVAAYIGSKWEPSSVTVTRDRPAEGELDCLLVVGSSGLSPYGDVLITERVEVPGDCGEIGAVMDDVLFQIDAKLGRLSKSNLAKLSTRSYLTKEGSLSRRELLMGVKSGFQRHSGLPFVFAQTCESKLGCAKCVDACPTRALRSDGGSIAVTDTACTKCGICAAVCPVGAIQMPEFSDDALCGLLDEVDESAVATKTLVLTCDGNAVDRKPGMVVEEVFSVGMFGPRQIAAAAASSLGGVAVVCADGGCIGKESAKRAVAAMSGSITPGPSAPFVVFAEGREGVERLAVLHGSSRARARRAPRSESRWKDYIGDLRSLASAESPASGLGFTRLTVAESCTLCSSCARNCPHNSLSLDERHLYFDASACTGCGHCAATCPEHSLTLSPSSGRMSQVLQTQELYGDELVACVKCGSPIGSAKFVNRVSTLLGPDAKFERYCTECKKRVVAGELFEGLSLG